MLLLAEQIDFRKKKRQRRLKDEKRRERKIDAEENRKMGIYVSPDLQLENLDLFPGTLKASGSEYYQNGRFCRCLHS